MVGVPTGVVFVRSLPDLPVFAWVLSGYSIFLPKPEKVQLIDDSKIP